MLARPDMARLVGSEDLIRVVAHDPRNEGYLAAYLCSQPGWLSIRSLIYGTSIKHIEPEQVERLMIPWLPDAVRITAGDKFRQAAERRARSMELIRRATDTAFAAAGIPDLREGEWQRWGRDLHFTRPLVPRSLRAWNFSPRAAKVYERLASAENCPLPTWTRDGTPRKGPSLARIDAIPPHAVQLISQRQLFRFVPDGRMVARRYIDESHRARPGTTLIASRGTFGEAEVFGRAQYVSRLGSAWVYSNDILRVVAAEPMHRGWLYAILRSQSAFRLLRSFATGSKQQDLHPDMLAQMPIPVASDAAYEQVQRLVDLAFVERDAAYEAEREAKVTILEAVFDEPA
jgi:type I restriction enzyme S subunit